jgi:hypothetical protein
MLDFRTKQDWVSFSSLPRLLLNKVPSQRYLIRYCGFAVSLLTLSTSLFGIYCLSPSLRAMSLPLFIHR